MTIAELPIAFDQRHELDPDRRHNRESLVWVVTDPVERIGLVGYTWVDAFGAAGAAGIAFGADMAPVFERLDDEPTAEGVTFADWKVGAIHVTHDGEDREARIAYAGEKLAMDLAFTPMGPAYAYTSHPDAFPAFFADERLEQGGRVTGSVRIGDREMQIDAFAHRDHSWGARDWGTVSHYKWLNFLAEDTSIHLMDLQFRGSGVLRGYVFRDGVASEITAASFEEGFDPDLVHRGLAVTLTDRDGRTTRARVTDARGDLAYPIDARLTLVDVVGTCEIEGREGAAYVEMAWPPEYLEHARTKA